MAVTTPPDSANSSEIRSLNDILDALQDAERGDCVSVRDILNEVGSRSFAPTILVPALILVSPLSGIFGLPTIGAIFIFLITIQKLAGRRHVWLPEFLKRREVKSDKLDRAIGWLRKPCAWIDARTHKRLTYFVSRPANIVTLLTIIGITLIIPFLEVLPMVTSVFAGAISLFAIGLLARDGLFTMLGYVQVGLSLALVAWLVSMGVG
ncbi:exopolysaccharide biosynthesis protein [Pseudooceanicola sp. MF1-13]|uniref:exopolysaccharide biosynthesis protein n=1 Tax=Pseudooceanicola sp. MF1-13 TaxID=3379095 RepID=UPI0038918DF0